MRPSLLALLLLFSGCTETIRFDHAPLGTLTSISITPGDAVLALSDLAPAKSTLQYSAVGTFADGTTRDVTDEVIWAIDRDMLGAFDAHGLFVASHAGTGFATVAARIDGLQATTSLEITLDVTIIDTTFPPPAANLFTGGRLVVDGDPTHAPSLTYPADGVVLPRLIASTLFQVDRGTGNDAIRLRFDSTFLHLRVETGADRWRADGSLQQLLAESAGLDPIRVTVDGTSSTVVDTPVYTSTPASFAFSTDLADTPLLYWSSATNGIMRGGVDLASASKLYPATGTCVGCHTMDHAGRTLAVSVDDGTGNAFQLETLDLASKQPLLPASAARASGWQAFSPDGGRLVVANNGVLTEYNPVTGASLGTIPLPAGKFATHPDWSPDGTSLVVALTSQAPTNLDVKAASIAVLPFDNGTWGAPTTVVTGGATTNSYFPRWSPGGEMIAFVRASTSSRGASSAELMLVPSAGGTPIPLALANRRVNGADQIDLANTMPSWAPRIGARLWLAFASSRPYGNVVSGGPPQIWVTSVDLTQSGDPSTPAFWLPCQDVTVMNTTPIWATTEVTTL